MSFAVARMTKLKADNLVGIGNHDQRKTTNHSNEDIDVSRSHLNYDLVAGRTNNFKTDIEAYINENKASKRAVRKDAVLVNEWIITSDKDFFEQLDETDTRKYFETAKQYFADNYGDENVRYAVVHMDEKTPHMHMGILERENARLRKLVNTLQNLVRQVDIFLERKMGIHLPDKFLERAGLKEPSKKAPESSQKLDRHKSDELGGPHL